MRRVVATLAVILALATPAKAQTAWPGNIKPLGYLPVVQRPEDGVLILVRSGGPARLWIRIELREARETEAGPLRSFVQLWDFDCAQRRLRPLQTTAYSGNNLDGDTQTDKTPGEWEYAIPASSNDSYLRLACEKASP